MTIRWNTAIVQRRQWRKLAVRWSRDYRSLARTDLGPPTSRSARMIAARFEAETGRAATSRVGGRCPRRSWTALATHLPWSGLQAA